ncbi:uncharacterized protein LOC111356963 [Spodoptera litura]|uniref:Uncharacterized protein LOC111356963 n=1 Tax=Spodoptera litura TaxID=69820 RepID=A0A9J7EEN3_SPOLT|nr:uncharacterized protein LOC111356963 [Spodoptera litura]
MFPIKLKLLLLYMIHYANTSGTRRIKDGVPVETPKKYVVYLVKAPLSQVPYDSWLCGGAIVSSEFVITSAACVNDVDYMYVISGYNKYIPNDELELDKCTASKKKRVIYTCVPKGYQLKYGELDYWSLIDIALVRVETPFDFNDATYEELCSYKPTPIAINYEEKYQEPGTDALVLGWGHIDKYRKTRDGENHNQELLMYAPTLLLNKTTCLEHYEDYTNMSYVIETYMICTLGKGNIDDGGNTIVTSLPIENGCTKEQSKILGFEGVSCEEEELDENSGESRRRVEEKDPLNQTYYDNMEAGFNQTFDWTWLGNGRRSGICQNDHGGPLITWSGAREILIGVASVFKVSEHYDCMGPYLFTSTLCTGLFLDCILTSEIATSQNDPKNTGRRDLCDRPSYEKGYETVERFIRWKDHHPPVQTAYNGRLIRSRVDAKSDPNDNRTSFVSSENNQETGAGKHPMNKMYFNINNPLRASAPKIDNPVEENNKKQDSEKAVVNDESDLNERYLAAPAIPEAAVLPQNAPALNNVGNVTLNGQVTFPANEPGNLRLPPNTQGHVPPLNEGILLNNGMSANNAGSNGVINNKMPGSNGVSINNGVPINNGKPSFNGMSENNRVPGYNRNTGNIPTNNAMSRNEGIPRNNGMQVNNGVSRSNVMSGSNGMQINNGLPGNNGISGSSRMQINNGMHVNNGMPGYNRMQTNNGIPGNIAINGNNRMPGNNGMTGNNRIPMNNGMQTNNGMQANKMPIGNIRTDRVSRNYQLQGNNRLPSNYNLPNSNGAQRNFQTNGYQGNVGINTYNNNKFTSKNNLPPNSQPQSNYKFILADRRTRNIKEHTPNQSN